MLSYMNYNYTYFLDKSNNVQKKTVSYNQSNLTFFKNFKMIKYQNIMNKTELLSFYSKKKFYRINLQRFIIIIIAPVSISLLISIKTRIRHLYEYTLIIILATN